MALRLHEIHPSLVHYPLALLPLAVLADTAGRVLGSSALMNLGRRLMPLAAGSAVLTGAAGLIAQQAVQPRGQAHELLTTHRNLNLALVAGAVGMAILRGRREKPSLGYLLAGLAAVGMMNYTAYLGGKMVYAHGVGVEPAGGVDAERSPEVQRGSMERVAQTARQHLTDGARRTVEHLRRGEIAPALRR